MRKGKGWREVQVAAPDPSCLNIKTIPDNLMQLANDGEPNTVNSPTWKTKSRCSSDAHLVAREKTGECFIQGNRLEAAAMPLFGHRCLPESQYGEGMG